MSSIDKVYEKRAGINITIDWEKFPELVAAIKRVEKDTAKRSSLLKIYRRQSAPYRKAAKRLSPSSENDRSSRIKHSRVTGYRPGNLRRSFVTRAYRKNPRDPFFTAVWTGPKAKKREGSGYYGYFLLQDKLRAERHKGRSKEIKALNKTRGYKKWNKQDWKQTAWNASRSEIEGRLSKELEKFLKGNFLKAGFEVK